MTRTYRRTMRRAAIAFLAAMALAPAARAQTIAWSILNNDIKDDLVTFLKTCPLSAKDSAYVENFNPNDSVFVVVYADPERGASIRELRLLGRPVRSDAFAAMPGALHDTIMHRNYPWIAVGGTATRALPGGADDIADAAMRTYARNSSWLGPTGMELAVPLRFAVRFGGGGGAVFAAIGDEDLGFPGSALSTVKLGLGFQGVKVYATLPVVTMREKRLEGALGAGVAYSAGHLGGEVQVGELPQFARFKTDGSDPTATAFLQNAAIMYYQGESVLESRGALCYKAGVAAYQVTRGYSNDGERFLLTDRLYYGGVWLRLDWVSPFVASHPAVELSLVSLIGNRSSFTLGATWNLARGVGLRAIATYTVLDEASKQWSTAFTPWGALVIRL